MTSTTHHQCVPAAPAPPVPLTVNEHENNTANTTDGMNCTNQTDGNGNITTACALVSGEPSSFSKWWLWLLLLLLLLCCLILLLMWLCGCCKKRATKKKRGKHRGGDVEQQDSFLGGNATNRNRAPSMPPREISAALSAGARSTDPLMLNQEPSAGEGSAFGQIDRNQDGVITRSELQFAQQMMGTQQLTQVIAGAAPTSFVSFPTGVQQQLAPPAVMAPTVMLGGQAQPVRSAMPGVTSMTGQAVMPQSFQPALRRFQGGYPVQSITTGVGNVMPTGAQTIR